MRSRHSVGRVVTTFGIPAGAPPEVEAAWARFDAVVAKHAAARDALANAEKQVEVAKRKDRDAAAQAIIAGQEAPPAKSEQKALVEVERQRQIVAGGEHAIDIVGDELARTIAAHRTPWREAANHEAEAALANYHDALDRLRAEAQALASARGALIWLDNVEVIAEHPIGHAVVEANMPGTDPLRLPRPAQHRLRSLSNGLEVIGVLKELN